MYYPIVWPVVFLFLVVLEHVVDGNGEFCAQLTQMVTKFCGSGKNETSTLKPTSKPPTAPTTMTTTTTRTTTKRTTTRQPAPSPPAPPPSPTKSPFDDLFNSFKVQTPDVTIKADQPSLGGRTKIIPKLIPVSPSPPKILKPAPVPTSPPVSILIPPIMPINPLPPVIQIPPSGMIRPPPLTKPKSKPYYVIWNPPPQSHNAGLTQVIVVKEPFNK